MKDQYSTVNRDQDSAHVFSLSPLKKTVPVLQPSEELQPIYSKALLPLEGAGRLRVWSRLTRLPASYLQSG